ncbi:hypothetical protein AWB79_06497 [Caballeronia hypogeia]|uniref:Uncharacterized protein n=1 Tax=Caballeronia hypogeia TaxID=1777140 RepID=A0A158D603_9BURK|nr:hypothetical protein [Caballeronia hypogeia]SAK89951.1 hypothetical protein AWB79_06497 [Caballeronia hypogeia]
MNVTSPTTSQTTQSTSHTLPIRRNSADIPTVETGTANTKTAPSNPAHLGNRIDTTA